MKLNEYLEQTKRTLNYLNDNKDDKLHMIYGIITEFGELVDISKKNLAYNKPIDLSHVIEEVGDLMWYISNLINTDQNLIQHKDYILNNFKLIPVYTEEFKRKTTDEYIFYRINVLISNLQDSIITSEYIRDREAIISLIAYIKDYCYVKGIDFEKCLAVNVDKLKVRYIEGFTSIEALKRNLDAEKDVLEKSIDYKEKEEETNDDTTNKPII